MADGDHRNVGKVVFGKELFGLPDKRGNRVEADAVQSAREVVRELRLGESALDDDFAFRFLRQPPQTADAPRAKGEPGGNGDAQSADRQRNDRQIRTHRSAR